MSEVTLAWRVVTSSELDGEQRHDLRRLWAEAFGDRFSHHDAAHAYGGVHVLAVQHDAASSSRSTAVAHASAIPRRLRVGERWHDAGYVEAVAVAPSQQGRGLGAEVMRRLHAELDVRWPFAMLSTGRATGFYSRLGWQSWLGVSSTLTSTGESVTDGEHGGLMVRTRPGVDELDRTLPVTCEDRDGDAW